LIFYLKYLIIYIYIFFFSERKHINNSSIEKCYENTVVVTIMDIDFIIFFLLNGLAYVIQAVGLVRSVLVAWPIRCRIADWSPTILHGQTHRFHHRNQSEGSIGQRYISPVIHSSAKTGDSHPLP
jgi:hypothetical protein